MTEEEKKNFLEISKRIGYKVGTYCSDEEIEVFEKLLKDYKYKNNLIQKQQEEIEKLRNKNKDLLRKLRNRVKEVKKLTKYSLYKDEFKRLNKQLEKKDKIIDLMAKDIYMNGKRLERFCKGKSEEVCQAIFENKNCDYCIKEYFEKKAEEN